MQTMARESWTDERLDDFGKHVDRRFDEVGGRFERFEQSVDRRFHEVNQRLDKVNDRFDRVDDKLDRVEGRLDNIQRTMVYALVFQTGGMIAGFIALFGLIATKL